MPVQWKLKQYLAVHNLSTYRLIQESKLAQGTAYRLVNGDTHNLNAATLDAVIGALRSLTGEQVEIQDVLEYQGVEAASALRLTAAGVPYTGDEETDWWLDNQPDILERIKHLEAGEEKLIPIEDIAAELGLELER